MHPIIALKAFWAVLWADAKGLFLKGEAAVKLAENDAKSEIIKARLAVIGGENRIKAGLLSTYQAEAAKVHAEADKIKADFDALLTRL